MPDQGAKREQGAIKGSQLWVLAGENPRRVSVQTGITDGRFTEITGGSLRAGQEVIVETLEANKKQQNPGAQPPRFLR